MKQQPPLDAFPSSQDYLDDQILRKENNKGISIFKFLLVFNKHLKRKSQNPELSPKKEENSMPNELNIQGTLYESGLF